MVAHVVLFKPKPGLDPAGRQRVAAAFERALREIPSIRRADVGRRILHGRAYEQLMAIYQRALEARHPIPAGAFYVPKAS